MLSVLEGMDQKDSAFSTGWKISKNMAFYNNVNNQVQFVMYRYWLAANKFEYAKLVTAFNQANSN